MNFNSLKEIIDFAIKREEEAADFYRSLSKKASLSGVKQMLTEFAEQEDDHKRMLQDLLEKGVAESVADYDFKWISDIKRSDYVIEPQQGEELDYRDVLLLAMKREEKALALYRLLYDKAEDVNAKDVFKVLRQEEAKHKLGLETMYDDYMAEMGD